ncbi:tyrosine-type recombinase/integrase [Micromonospora aurantiaca (nom. illeg.)]|uniref:tyrosine-type recombinase/integrase n=1 Tax=Micromonospora aurantiaca (nom. illeg.) TaxID=47850 RepID=UPI0033D5CCD1
MDLPGGPQRDITKIVLPMWGRIASGVVVPFELVDDDGASVEPVNRFLRDFTARGNRAGSVRSYAFVLQRWFRFLLVVGVPWDRATSAETRDLVLWFGQTTKPIAGRRTRSALIAGTVNPVTRKQHLDNEYAPRTIRHNNSVLRAFYQFWIEEGVGPLVNPVPLARPRGRRANAHHNPLEPFRAGGRLRYNPTIPKRKPRAMPDPAWTALFGAMRSDRDRAILVLAISTGARASELLRMRAGDVDWGDQLIRVRRKGTDAEQWLPASPEAFVWLRLYLAALPPLRPGDALWWTLRRNHGLDRPHRTELTYDALRAVLRRANETLGSNWTMHDCRHTCALRMVRDQNLSLRDVQTILGHAHIATTQIYLEDDDAEVIKRVRQHHAERQAIAAAHPALPRQPAAGYDPADMAVLFGTGSVR